LRQGCAREVKIEGTLDLPQKKKQKEKKALDLKFRTNGWQSNLALDKTMGFYQIQFGFGAKAKMRGFTRSSSRYSLITSKLYITQGQWVPGRRPESRRRRRSLYSCCTHAGSAQQ